MAFGSLKSGERAVDGGDANAAGEHPLLRLPREDLDFIVELVVKSGSLKDVAAVYGVSYPTIRGRLDKVITRLEAARSGVVSDPMTNLLAGMIERGQLTAAAARAIRQLHQRTVDERGARTPREE